MSPIDRAAADLELYERHLATTIATTSDFAKVADAAAIRVANAHQSLMIARVRRDGVKALKTSQAAIVHILSEVNRHSIGKHAHAIFLSVPRFLV